MPIGQHIPQQLKQLFRTKRPATTTQAVKRSRASYMQERGWRLGIGWQGLQWHGYYRTRRGSFRGLIRPSYPPQFYVRHPPEGLDRHNHRICFAKVNRRGWWSVHFRQQPADLDSGVIALERILHECVLLSKQTG